MASSSYGNNVQDPQILFLPFAVPDPQDTDPQDTDPQDTELQDTELQDTELKGSELLGDEHLDESVLARRIPDFLHLLLNGGRALGPTAMLEIQSAPDDGPARWVTLSDPPDPVEVLSMLGPEDRIRALVTGSMRRRDRHLAIDVSINFAAADPAAGPGRDDNPAAGLPRGIHGVVQLAEPVPGLLRLAEHLAAVLRLPRVRPDVRLLTASPSAFYRYLDGLDGAALLGGDPELEQERRGEALVSPLADALRLDPGFGLALRAMASSLFAALEDERVEETACLRTLDRCLDSRPGDGEGCVAIAEQLAMIGELDRATRWLDHAVALDPPVPRALEALGVLLANRGEIEQARALWRRGAELSGWPNFYAHLARLSFADDDEAAAWQAVECGLRRTWERVVRAAEWPASDRSPNVLLSYLADTIGRGGEPPAVIDALVALHGELRDPQVRVDLGLCLEAAGHGDAAIEELRAGFAELEKLPSVTIDRGVRALLRLEVPDFDQRFHLVRRRTARGGDHRQSVADLESWLELQPEFWQGRYYLGVALRQLGDDEAALDTFAELLRRRPGQVDALAESAELFAARGNPKRALECVDDAIASYPDVAELHLRRARYLEQLGRDTEAEAALESAAEFDARAEFAAEDGEDDDEPR